VHGHHRWAATELDSTTARLGESFYAFLPRTIAGQFREAFCFEQKRTTGRRYAIVINRVIQDVVLMAVLLAVIILMSGWVGVIFFVAQSLVAIIVLEMFNYIAHYGLKRQKISEKRWERLDDRHSWNSSNVFANLLIFNMGRHSCHHRKPTTSYEGLQFLQHAPELPFGYAASILLALVPPLWRRVMDPRARKFGDIKHQDVLLAPISA
jgi:alkane 1-monooxygenase